MSVIINFPESVLTRLKRKAEREKQSIEEVTVHLVDRALAEDVNTEMVDAELVALVKRIQATPPNPAMIRPATGSLAEYLAESLAREVTDPEAFDQAEWDRAWDAIEQEMKAVTRANDIAEGRG